MTLSRARSQSGLLPLLNSQGPFVHRAHGWLHYTRLWWACDPPWTVSSLRRGTTLFNLNLEESEVM